MYQETCTIAHTGENEYNLLIQNEKNRVMVMRRGITWQELIAEIENRIYLTEAEDG